MSTKKNILIVSQSNLSYTETFIRAHTQKLEGNIFFLHGWKLDYKTKDDISLLNLYNFDKNKLSIKSLLPHYLYFRINRKQKQRNSKSNLIKRYIKQNKIDVVLAEYGTSGSFIAPICDELSLPLVVHFHGIDASKYDLLNEFKLAYRRMFRVASSIIVVSNRMKLDIERMGCPIDKIIYNPYGPNNGYSKVKPNYTSNNIIAIGHHNFKKAPYLTILAFYKVLKQLPHLKLHFIGGGELIEISQNIVKALHLEDRIIFHGKKSREEIILLMDEMFMFVQHSIIAGDGNSEGTPVAILESMFSALPVVSTFHAGIPDVVINGKTGFLLSEGDIEGMALKIIDLAQDRKKAKQFGEEGRKQVLANFTMERHINRLNRILKEAVYNKSNSE